MNKVLMSLVVRCFYFRRSSFRSKSTTGCCCNLPAAAPVVVVPETVKPAHHEHHAELRKAMRKLRGAKEDLQKAAHDYGGHKVKAIAAIDEALAELKEAMDYDKK